jgi:hypothetical protein
MFCTHVQVGTNVSGLMSEIREIWYQRYLWGYIPIHWKGLLVLVSGISIVVANCFVGLMIADNHPIPSGACYALAIGMFLALFVIANQHSEQ